MNDDIQRNATGVLAVSHQFFSAIETAQDASPATALLRHTGTSIHPPISASNENDKDKHSMNASVTSLSLNGHVD